MALWPEEQWPEGGSGSRDNASLQGTGAASLGLVDWGSHPTTTMGSSKPMCEASAGWWLVCA